MSRSIRNFTCTIIFILLVFLFSACNTPSLSGTTIEGNVTSTPTNENSTNCQTEAETATKTETEVDFKTDIETEIQTTEFPDTEVPDTKVPDTKVPDTKVPDTEVPDTKVPDTEVPDTEVPDTEVPDTEVPDTEVPDTEILDTKVPETEIPDTEVPDTEIPDTAPPKTDLFDLPTPTGYYVLTFDNLNELAFKHNVVYFVIDRFDWEYYVRAREKAPEIFYNLDNGGFTYYDDAISLYPRTFPSITYMITGAKNDFSTSRASYFKSAYSKSEFIRKLYNENYNINIYTASYYAYNNATYMANYASNAKPVQSGKKAYNTDMCDVYNYITQSGLHIGEHEKSYSFIHISGTHPPQKYDENFNPLPEGSNLVGNSTLGMKLSFKIINYYIDEMKRLGVYDNSTIIITGDHCSIGSDSEVPLRYAHVTPLFVKPSSTANGKLQVSSAPVSHEDIFPTILKSENIKGASDFGKSVFEFSSDAIRERLYYFQKLNKTDGKTNYDMVIFAINGKAADYGNWKIQNWYSLGKNIYS